MVSTRTKPGRRLGSFEVLQELGQGGMGVVYLARQPALERLVVLKKIRRELAADSGIVERFEREARAAGTVHHQNVVAVYDCFSIRGDHYIAQEFVDGVDLLSVMAQLGRLPVEIAARVALEVVRGLEEIHGRAVVHRDLKPANILIGDRGEVKIADFGVALECNGDGLTRPGTMLGSIPYMSPEQMLGERADYRSDLFSLGVCLYEMSTGAPPFRCDDDGSTETLLKKIRRGAFVPPRQRCRQVPRYLDRIIRTCLRPKPSQRTASVAAIRRVLERRLRHASPADSRWAIAAFLWERGVLKRAEQPTRPRRATPAAKRWVPGSRWVWGTVGAALLLAVGIAGWGISRRADSPPLEPLSEPAVERPLETGTERISAASVPVPAEAVSPGETVLPVPSPVPASLRVSVWPWAEVRIGDAEAFLTPRAAPLKLAPGQYQVVLEHPGYGRAEYTLELEAGDRQLLHHVFEEAPTP